MGDIKGDTRSVDYDSNWYFVVLVFVFVLIVFVFVLVFLLPRVPSLPRLPTMPAAFHVRLARREGLQLGLQ